MLNACSMTTDPIDLTLNGDPAEATPGASLADLLLASGRDPERPGIAVARNEQVVPRAKWAETTLAPGDRVEVLTALAGG